MPDLPPRTERPRPPLDPSHPAKPGPGLGARLQAAKRRRANRPDPEQAAKQLDDPRMEAGAEDLAALAMDDLAASSPPGRPGQALRIPRSYLDALLNI